jgi:hypothetical protein
MLAAKDGRPIFSMSAMLIDKSRFRRFARIDTIKGRVPAEKMIFNFRYLLDEH